ncbi:MAG: ATP-binding cassette, subfamily er 3 [Chloroflexia bacterium]|jgi:ATP-binding cassette subfamily F protein 3|nr:ATP-binding cassette, subfamily er 3 [Chloroflexia bacterium]
MLLVQFAGVSKDYAGNPVFDEVDLEIIEGERIGLVGENGGGKSTLMRLVAGLDTPTEGSVSRRRNLTIGYLRQEADPLDNDKTIFQAVSEVSPEAATLSARLRELEAKMTGPDLDGDGMSGVFDEYGEVMSAFEALGGYEVEHNVESVLEGLGFGPARHSQQVGTLSGGEKKLVSLARILLLKPDLLLLDEPDNHLDLDAKAWLESFIQGYPGTVIVVSHDRFLLDRVAKKIFELQDGKIEIYHGNYTYFAEERERRLLKRHEMYTLQQDEIKRLEVILRNLKQWARQNPKFAPRADSMEKRLDRARREAAERPIVRRERVRFNFDSERSGQKVLEAKGLSKSVGARELFAPFDLMLYYGERVGIVGPNGSGKTTLLRTIVGQLPPDRGTVKIGASVVLGYYSQEQETLPGEMTPLDFVRSLKPLNEQAAISLLRRLLFSYRDAHHAIRELSGGEKSRLQVARLMLTDANFLVLDEPTNNLDIASVEVLEDALNDFQGTLLTVSHDRYFMDRVVTHIVAIEPGGRVREYPGNYSEYLSKRSAAAELALSAAKK